MSAKSNTKTKSSKTNTNRKYGLRKTANMDSFIQSVSHSYQAVAGTGDIITSAGLGEDEGYRQG